MLPIVIYGAVFAEAGALGIVVPPTLLASAAEVIEIGSLQSTFMLRMLRSGPGTK
jgi:hypothetical protein